MKYAWFGFLLRVCQGLRLKKWSAALALKRVNIESRMAWKAWNQ